MKTKWVLMALVVGLGVVSTANSQEDTKQQTNKDKVTVRVRMTEEKDGKTETIERSYTYNNLTGDERESKIKAIVDSLKGNDKNATNRRMSIIIEEGDGMPERRIGSREERTQNRTREYRSGPNNNRSEQWNNNRDDKFPFDEEAFADRMKRIEKKIEPQMRKLERNMENWSRDFEPKFKEFWEGDVNFRGSQKPASVRGLEAFPNNPEKNELNLRFYAPIKGDVLITVTDTKGKQIAKKEVKDFSGDFVGQIDLGKNPKGTYFVSVVQNEDGAVKRIVIE
ncbi:T9SS type A sorting domain-containing protein [Runella sp. MFBS21]|uniref:T9SS type A sorting domain-containing protein n=1 Tax=Runella sp. MFBS21 TaxID=3034018 RepID=UPI0023F64889|nr:T9SS type A sorting domain-containing protein [Runella sp. MFBS21]MDF7816503.1 T9SS type A sorting domain-containing protein [Runella sp. MFBS21]